MSFRDMRNFAEMMKSLGYPYLISMENFRTPNFPLLSAVLIWIIGRFDPEYEMPTDYESEKDRVKLIRAAGHFMASNLGIKINMKHLYQADGYSVRELLKPVSLLYNAYNVSNENMESRQNANFHEIMSRMQNMKDIRSLVMEITSKGAALYDLIKEEGEIREIRNEKVHKQLQLNEVEDCLKKALETIKSEISNLKQLIENVSQTEASLDSKIEKKSNELERSRKRLKTLRKVKPAYQEEFVRLEQELKGLTLEYVVKYRNLAYLEQQMEEADQAEQERLEQKQALTKNLITQLKNEDTLLDASLEISKEGGELDKEPRNERIMERPQPARNTRVRIKTATGAMRQASAAAEQQRRVFGNMTGTGEEDEDSSGSLESDSDILLVDEDVGSELIGTDDDDLDDNIGETKRRHAQRSHTSAGSSTATTSKHRTRQVAVVAAATANAAAQQPSANVLSDDDF